MLNKLRIMCDTCDSKKCKTLVGARTRTREKNKKQSLTRKRVLDVSYKRVDVRR